MSLSSELERARKYFDSTTPSEFEDARQINYEALEFMNDPAYWEVRQLYRMAYGSFSDEELWDQWVRWYIDGYTYKQIGSELQGVIKGNKNKNKPVEKKEDMAALVPLLAEGASAALPELMTAIGGAEGVSKIGNLLYSQGGKKMASDILGKVKMLAGTREGRAKLLSGVGKATDIGFKTGARGVKLLSKTPLLSQNTANKILSIGGKGHRGFQSALGSISKVGKHFGFL